MTPNLSKYIILTLVIFGCSSTIHSVKLSTLKINGKKQNELIQDRIPNYGIGSPDGCVIMGEISLNLETVGKDSIRGTVRESDKHQALPFATVKLQSDKQNDLSLQTDSAGNFRTRIPPELKAIQIEYIGFRTLTVDLTEMKK